MWSVIPDGVVKLLSGDGSVQDSFFIKTGRALLNSEVSQLESLVLAVFMELSGELADPVLPGVE